MNTETSGGFTTANQQNFVPGIQGYSNASLPLVNTPSRLADTAIRWLFNPFAFVNISDRPVSGHAFLKAGIFIPIQNQSQLIALPNQPALSPGSSFAVGDDGSRIRAGLAHGIVDPPGYRSEIRTAYAIANEIADAYTDRGVQILAPLTKFDDFATVDALHKAFVAPGLVYALDPYQPEYPVPNLIALEKYLMTSAAKDARSFSDPTLDVDPSALVADILTSVRTALALCRNVTREAKRVVANKTLGYVHAFDAYQGRCFIALGEDVPSDLPFVSDSGHMSAAGTGAGDELSRLRAENESYKLAAKQAEIDDLRMEVEKLKRQQIPSAGSRLVYDDSLESIAAVCGATKADGDICQAVPTKGSTRCRHHPLETEAVAGS